MKIHIGSTYKVKTYAGPIVHMKITKIDDDKQGMYIGVLVRREDVISLRNASVPYEKNVPLEKTVGYVSRDQIISRDKPSKPTSKSIEKINKHGTVVRRRKRV